MFYNMLKYTRTKIYAFDYWLEVGRFLISQLKKWSILSNIYNSTSQSRGLFIDGKLSPILCKKSQKLQISSGVLSLNKTVCLYLKLISLKVVIFRTKQSWIRPVREHCAFVEGSAIRCE